MTKLSRNSLKLVAVIIILVLAGLTTAILISGLQSFSTRNFLEGIVTGIVAASLVIWLIVLIRILIRKGKDAGKPDAASPRPITAELWLPLGMLSLMAAILLIQLGGQSVWLSILAIPLFILSIVCNVTALNRKRKQTQHLRS